MEYLKDIAYLVKVLWPVEAIVALLSLVAGIIMTNMYRWNAWAPFAIMALATVVFTLLVWVIMRWAGPE